MNENNAQIKAQTKEKAAKKAKTWDAPTRITHWALAALVIAAYITGDGLGKTWGEDLSLHRTIAVWIVGLLIFRLIWGFVGNAQAKFHNFPFGLDELQDDVKTFASRSKSKHHPGHGPTGAWATAAILIIVLLQVVSGLFSASVEENVYGPLAPYAPQLIGNVAVWVHGTLGGLFPLVVLLHVVAIFWHEIVRGHRLLIAMITGYRPVSEGVEWEPERPKRALIALAISLVIVLVLFLI
ncbi:MAG: cytochrome b/b6 domain-containing protein [Alphaproteobacteria bacterium]